MYKYLRGSMERLLYQSDALTIGVFNCPRQHPSFHDSGPIGNDILVFPRHAVYIKHTGTHPILANRHVVTLYNKGQVYRRDAHADYGDFSVWFNFTRELLVGMLEQAGYYHRRVNTQPFSITHQVCSTTAFLQERLLYRYLLSENQKDQLLVEETALQLLDQILLMSDKRRANANQRQGTQQRHIDLVAHCKAKLTGHWGAKFGLETLASHLHTTSFHLARVFKQHAGISIHQYRLLLRLRWAADCLLNNTGQRLTDLALDAGFATPSHFSQAFRRHFGMSPKDIDKQKLSNILTVGITHRT